MEDEVQVEQQPDDVMSMIKELQDQIKNVTAPPVEVVEVEEPETETRDVNSDMLEAIKSLQEQVKNVASGSSVDTVNEVLYRKELDGIMANEDLKEILTKEDEFGETVLQRIERKPVGERNLALKNIVDRHAMSQPLNPNRPYRTQSNQAISKLEKERLNKVVEKRDDLVNKFRDGTLSPTANLVQLMTRG